LKLKKLDMAVLSTYQPCWVVTKKTIRKGLKELDDQDAMKRAGTRMTGGGPKSKIDSIESIDEVFLEVLRLNTAGEPMKENVKWTHLSNGN